MPIFFSSFSYSRVINKFVIFHQIKVEKFYLEPMLPPGGRNWQLIYPIFSTLVLQTTKLARSSLTKVVYKNKKVIGKI